MFKFFKKWIEKLGEQNNQIYGRNKLDCCDLNSSSEKEQKLPEQHK